MCDGPGSAGDTSKVRVTADNHLAGVICAIGTLVGRATRYTMLIHFPAGRKAPQFRDVFLAGTAEIPPHLRPMLT